MNRRSFLSTILAAFAVRAGAAAGVPLALDAEYGDEQSSYFLSGLDGDFVSEKWSEASPFRQLTVVRARGRFSYYVDGIAADREQWERLSGGSYE